MLSLMYAGEMCYWHWQEASKTATQDISTDPSAKLTNDKNEIRCGLHINKKLKGICKNDGLDC